MANRYGGQREEKSLSSSLGSSSSSTKGSLSTSQNGENPLTGLLRKSRNERSARLASVLATRLSYASLKVSRGWIQQNIHEVENLYSSRFRHQAEERASSKAGSRSLKRPAPGKQQQEHEQEHEHHRQRERQRRQQSHSHQAASIFGTHLHASSSSSLSSSSSIPPSHHYFNHSVLGRVVSPFPSPSGPDEQPLAYFAPDDAPLHSTTTTTTSNTSTTATGHGYHHHHHHATSYTPSESYTSGALRRYPDTMTLSLEEHDSSSSATPPPLQQPSPSMYAYLASPIISSHQSPGFQPRASFSSTSSSSQQQRGAPFQMATIDEGADSASGATPLFPDYHNDPSTTSSSDPRNNGPVAAAPAPPSGTSNSPFHVTHPSATSTSSVHDGQPFAQAHAQQYPHSGPPSGHVRQSSGLLFPTSHHQGSHSTQHKPAGSMSQGSVAAFPSYLGDPGSLEAPGTQSSSVGGGGAIHSNHRRNLSHGMRGDYSMSSVTMDDLDSHFGSA